MQEGIFTGMIGFWIEFKNTLLSPSRVLIWLGISGIAAFTGPFGTHSAMSLPVRSLYWFSIVGAAFIIAVAARHFWPRLFPHLKYAWISILIALTIASVITPLANFVLRPAFQPDTTNFQPVGRLFFLIFFLTISADLFWYQIIQKLREEIRPAKKASGPRLLERLPVEDRAEIMLLSGRDHRVEVRTVKGVSHIRLRLGDAIAEMEGVDGFCAHRSHWVTRAAVVGNGMEGKRPFLVLKDGTKVPVSQKHEAAIRARGLL